MFTKFVLSYDHRVDEKYVQVIKKFLGENGYGCLEINLNDCF